MPEDDDGEQSETRRRLEVAANFQNLRGPREYHAEVVLKSANSGAQHMSTIETQAEQEHPTSGKARHGFRFSLRGVLIFVAFVAATVAFFVQQRRLANVQAALSRYESTQIPTSLAPNQFRIIVQTVDTNHVKLVKYRIESLDEHFATLDNGEGDTNGSRSNQDANTGLHFTEVTVLVDHVVSQKCVKMLPKVGGGQGYSILPVADDYSLDEATTFNEVNGVFSRNETVELFQWDGKAYSLTLK